MKITIEDGHFSYQVDWAKDPELEEGDIPTVEDCIESFLRLLENIHPKEKIATYNRRGYPVLRNVTHLFFYGIVLIFVVN